MAVCFKFLLYFVRTGALDGPRLRPCHPERSIIVKITMMRSRTAEQCETQDEQDLGRNNYLYVYKYPLVDPATRPPKGRVRLRTASFAQDDVADALKVR